MRYISSMTTGPSRFNHPLSLRLLPEEAEAIRVLARRAGMRPSVWMRLALRETAERIFKQHGETAPWLETRQ